MTVEASDGKGAVADERGWAQIGLVGIRTSRRVCVLPRQESDRAGPGRGPPHAAAARGGAGNGSRGRKGRRTAVHQTTGLCREWVDQGEAR